MPSKAGVVNQENGVWKKLMAIGMVWLLLTNLFTSIKLKVRLIIGKQLP